MMVPKFVGAGHEGGTAQSGSEGPRRRFSLQIASTNQIACKAIRDLKIDSDRNANIFKTDGSADLSAISASSAFKLLRATKDALQVTF